MSDTVDDLHDAEDLAGRLAGALEDLMGSEGGEPGLEQEAWDAAVAALASYEHYCRGSCGAGRSETFSHSCSQCERAVESVGMVWLSTDYRGTSEFCFGEDDGRRHVPQLDEDGDRDRCEDDDPECCGCQCHNRYDKRHGIT